MEGTTAAAAIVRSIIGGAVEAAVCNRTESGLSFE